MDTYKDGGAELEGTYAALEVDDIVTEGALGVHDDGCGGREGGRCGGCSECDLGGCTKACSQGSRSSVLTHGGLACLAEHTTGICGA